jgi:site-specific DNA-methyltransferase (cytosine-N4-specific)
MFSVIGDTVVDPFLGSGTTIKVAMDTNRHSLGYEIDTQLIPTLKDRFAIEEEHNRFIDDASVKTLTITQRKDSV